MQTSETTAASTGDSSETIAPAVIDGTAESVTTAGESRPVATDPYAAFAATLILVTDEPVRVLADGSAVPAGDPRTDYVAVLFPDGWLVAASLTANKYGSVFSNGDDAVEAVKQTDLLGFTDWENAPLDDVLLRHVIKHDRHSPAVDTRLFPNFPNRGWIRSDITPWSEQSAFCVGLSGGVVGYGRRSSSGFGLPCRRARQ